MKGATSFAATPAPQAEVSARMLRKSKAHANQASAVQALLMKVSSEKVRKEDPAPAPPPELMRAPPSGSVGFGKSKLPPAVASAPNPASLQTPPMQTLAMPSPQAGAT